MKTKVALRGKVQGWSDDVEEFPYAVYLSDWDAGHTHDDGYHVFFCTREQLRSLYRQLEDINAVD